MSNLIRHYQQTQPTMNEQSTTNNQQEQETTPRLNSLLKDTMDAAMDAIHAQLAQLRSSLDDIPTLQKLEVRLPICSVSPQLKLPLRIEKATSHPSPIRLPESFFFEISPHSSC